MTTSSSTDQKQGVGRRVPKNTVTRVNLRGLESTTILEDRYLLALPTQFSGIATALISIPAASL